MIRHPRLPRLLRWAALAAACHLGVAATAPRTASAFCGFYVSGGDAKLYNNATLVVLMRDGTRTVLSMQNNYQGPPQDFALVIPVPVILKEQDVKTLPAEIFGRVDSLAAPRLVEYWEQDPCAPPVPQPMTESADAAFAPTAAGGAPRDGGFGVTVEAQFTVGEYRIEILSAKDATGLDGWLRANKYSIPAGADEVLRPYVQSGMKFFVAKVDTARVKFDAQGQAMLSPLRFHYDSEGFNLPVRLGLLNSAGAQDLLVHVLARSRYAVANYPNVTIPTNLEVKDRTRENFGSFYVSLFDETLAQNPRAVVTEYAWQANNCDPCPVDPLSLAELVTLGADVMPGLGAGPDGKFPEDAQWRLPGELVLTRLHARYTKDSLGEDLVFQEAKPVTGGREFYGTTGIERGATPAEMNYFQARYIIRHRWTGEVECKEPRYGVWGGPPQGEAHKPAVARNLAFAPRDASLGSYVAESVPELKLAVDVPPSPPRESTPGAGAAPGKPADGKSAGGCASCRVDAPVGAGWLALLLLGLVRRRRA